MAGPIEAKSLIGKKVRVSYNLARCSWDKPSIKGERCFTVRPTTGNVLGYTDKIFLKNVTFKISKAGHTKVVEKGVRHVFAYIEGTVAKMPAGAASFPEMTFNPFKDTTFVLRSGRVPLKGCTGAYFDGRTVRCRGPKKSTVPKPKGKTITAKDIIRGW